MNNSESPPTNVPVGDLWEAPNGDIYEREKDRWIATDFEGNVVDIIEDISSEEKAYKRAMSIL